MIDIVTVSGGDLVIQQADTPKAKNVLQVQIGSLEYAPDFGIDLKFFLDPNFQFQNESFKAYLVQRLAEHHVSVNQVIETEIGFQLKWAFEVGDERDQSKGFIR